MTNKNPYVIVNGNIMSVNEDDLNFLNIPLGQDISNDQSLSITMKQIFDLESKIFYQTANLFKVPEFMFKLSDEDLKRSNASFHAYMTISEETCKIYKKNNQLE